MQVEQAVPGAPWGDLTGIVVSPLGGLAEPPLMEFEPETLTLEDEADGTRETYVVLQKIEHQGRMFYAVAPVAELEAIAGHVEEGRMIDFEIYEVHPDGNFDLVVDEKILCELAERVSEIEGLWIERVLIA